MKSRPRITSVALTVAALGLALACGDSVTTPSTGTLQVQLTTTGAAMDPDGYQLSLDQGAAQTIYSGESQEFTGLDVGSHVVLLSDLAAGCTVNGANPRAVSVASGEMTTVLFEMSCEVTAATSVEDPRAAILAGGTYEKVTPKDSVLTSDTLTELRDDGYWSCTVESRSAVDAPDDYATFNPNAEIIYPGSMLQGATLAYATPEPIVVSRAGGTLVINLLNGSAGVFQTVDEVRQSTVVQAINDILAANSGIVPARFTYTSNEVQSREQMALDMGVNVSTLSMDFRSKMNFSMDQHYNRFLVQMIQSYYTVSFDLPRSVGELIAPGVTGEEITRYVGPGNPATYISSVTYGRRFFLLIESTSSVMDMKASIQASYDAAVVNGNMDMDMTYVKDLQNVNIKVFALGGDQSLATATFNGDFDAIRAFLTQGADIRTGVPLSYVVRNVADNTIVNVKVATDYDIKTCTPTTGPGLFSGFSSAKEGWTSDGNGTDPLVQPAWRKAADCGSDMGGCVVMHDWLSALPMQFKAPWSWVSHRSWSAFYGGSIEFYLRFAWAGDITGWWQGPALLIQGPAGMLTLDIPPGALFEAGVGWRLFSLNLDETGTPYGYWQFNLDHNATRQEIQNVLADVIDFRIRGDAVMGGYEDAYLDGVSVKPPAGG